MRESGKRQGIDKWINGWSCLTCFQKRKCKWKIKHKDVNKDNKSTHFNFSIWLVIYKKGKVEIRHEPSWYDKEQLPYLTSTQLILFDEVHIKQVSGPPMTRKFNEHKIRFPRDEEGNIDVKTGKYDTNNQPKKADFKYKQESRLCIGVANIEIKDGNITGKWFPVFYYPGKKIVTIDAYKK